MMLANYTAKKDLKAALGQPLRYIETSVFGPEYRTEGWLTVAHHPHIQGGREWFARVFMAAGLIAKVE